MNLIIEASPRAVERIVPYLRKEDREELEAYTGKDPLQVLLNGIVGSREAWCVYDGKVPFALFGVCTDVTQMGVGVPWMVGTDAIKNHSLYVARQTKRWISILSRGYDRLENTVDERNQIHIRWLKWAGFTVENKGISLRGTTFLPFHMELKQCVPLPQ